MRDCITLVSLKLQCGQGVFQQETCKLLECGSECLSRGEAEVVNQNNLNFVFHLGCRKQPLPVCLPYASPLKCVNGNSLCAISLNPKYIAQNLPGWRGWTEGAEALRSQVLFEVDLDCAFGTQAVRAWLGAQKYLFVNKKSQTTCPGAGLSEVWVD